MAQDRRGRNIVAGDRVTLHARVIYVLEDGACLIKIEDSGGGRRSPSQIVEGKDLDLDILASHLAVPA